MKYPKYISKGSTIGMCAPSAGMGEKIEELEFSIEQLKQHGYRVVETESLRNSGLISASGQRRAQELMKLYENEEIDVVMAATGGDFLSDMLPYVDYGLIAAHPKWFQGYSDPTWLTYTITTKCDIATVYGLNGGGFDMLPFHPSMEDNLKILQGEEVTQNSFSYYQSGWGEGTSGYQLDSVVEWKTINGLVDCQGRLLGGCIDVLQYLVGTEFDDTSKFIKKYQEDGIIWYFDIFALKAEDLSHVLFQMKHAGWFDTAKGFVFGRVRFPDTLLKMSYEEAIIRVLGDELPIVTQADIGHVKPVMTLMNGAIAKVTAQAGKGKIVMEYRE